MALKSKSEEKRDKKKCLLIDAAIKNFRTKGIDNTTVTDIVNDAGVAKGTFYLYFKDKNELVGKIIIMEASDMLENALKKANKLDTDDIGEKVVFIADEIIRIFENNKKNMEIIRKNLYTGLFSKDENGENLFSRTVDEFINQIGSTDVEKSQKRLYILTEMIGGVCYNSIYKDMPYSMEEIKSELFECIRSIVDYR